MPLEAEALVSESRPVLIVSAGTPLTKCCGALRSIADSAGPEGEAPSLLPSPWLFTCSSGSGWVHTRAVTGVRHCVLTQEPSRTRAGFPVSHTPSVPEPWAVGHCGSEVSPCSLCLEARPFLGGCLPSWWDLDLLVSTPPLGLPTWH